MFNPLSLSRVSQSRLCWTLSCGVAFDISMDRHSITFLHNLIHCLTTLRADKHHGEFLCIEKMPRSLHLPQGLITGLRSTWCPLDPQGHSCPAGHPSLSQCLGLFLPRGRTLWSINHSFQVCITWKLAKDTLVHHPDH